LNLLKTNSRDGKKLRLGFGKKLGQREGVKSGTVDQATLQIWGTAGVMKKSCNQRAERPSGPGGPTFQSLKKQKRSKVSPQESVKRKHSVQFGNSANTNTVGTRTRHKDRGTASHKKKGHRKVSQKMNSRKKSGTAWKSNTDKAGKLSNFEEFQKRGRHM